MKSFRKDRRSGSAASARAAAGKRTVNLGLASMIVPGAIALIIFNYLNFEYLVLGRAIWIITTNTVLYNLVFILLGNAVAVAVALGLDSLRAARFARFYQGRFSPRSSVCSTRAFSRRSASLP